MIFRDKIENGRFRVVEELDSRLRGNDNYGGNDSFGGNDNYGGNDSFGGIDSPG